MSKKRVHELAKDLGMDNREVVLALQAAGISVKTHSSSVYEEEALAVLNKVKNPEPAAPARRPGMMIVKKKRQVEAEKPKQQAAEVEAHEVEAPESVTPPAVRAPQAQAPVQTEPVVSASTPKTQMPSSKPVVQANTPTPVSEDQPAASAPQAAMASQASKPATVQTPAQAQPATSKQPQTPAPASEKTPQATHAPVSQVKPSTTSQPEGRPVLQPRQEFTPPKRNERRVEVRPRDRDVAAGASNAPQRPHTPNRGQERVERNKPETAPQQASRPNTSRPGAATVVRMIDRDKLLERVPGRRLGGESRGGGGGEHRGGGGTQGGPRFGQVTELKVVNDPFGRGREMVTVGRDKRKGPGAGGGKPGANGPGGGRGGKGGRSNNRREMSDMRERSMYPSRLKKKKTNQRVAKKTEMTQPKASKRVIKMKETIVVADLAHQMGVKAVDIIRRLMAMGSMVTQNQSIDFDTATLMAAEFEYTVESIAFEEKSVISTPATDDTAGLTERPPVVTVMGHVDHGKTSLLDAIRKKRVAAGEAGGITQHIGAYSVPVGDRGTVTFLDTPGHAAFTSMRARGAKVTDIVVLVVAADDGVMPQTEEAIQHAQAAKVPIIVAINKSDKPEANPDRVMQELTKYELVPEAWGGDTMYVQTSATKETGITELLEGILLQAELLELKANPKRPASGIVIEAQLDRGRGPVATVLVQDGTLRRGDAIVVGVCSGKIRAMMDDSGTQFKEAGPSAAMEITGLDAVPQAGDVLNVVDNSEAAREVAEHRAGQRRVAEQAGGNAMSLDDLMKRIEGAATLELRVVLKADVQGSVEAVKAALLKLSTDEVKVNIIYGGVGGIKESDIMLAAASQGLVLGFGVRPDSNARQVAEHEGVEIRTYNIIYEAVDEIRRAMEGLLAPESREKIVGRAEIRELFKVSKVGTIGGCRIVEGKAIRAARVRVLRDSVQVYDGKVSSLRHFKNDVREVEHGQECGVGVEGYNDLKMGDVIEFYQMEEIARTLSQNNGNPRRGALGQEASSQA